VTLEGEPSRTGVEAGGFRRGLASDPAGPFNPIPDAEDLGVALSFLREGASLKVIRHEQEGSSGGLHYKRRTLTRTKKGFCRRTR
jgi:hypothetical protein